MSGWNFNSGVVKASELSDKLVAWQETNLPSGRDPKAPPLPIDFHMVGASFSVGNLLDVMAAEPDDTVQVSFGGNVDENVINVHVHLIKRAQEVIQ